VFHYYGEGQVGDMAFKGGNSAILRHAENEKELHLFEKVRAGFLRYRGEMACSGYEFREEQDHNGDPRRAIVFQLVRVGAGALGETDGGDLTQAALDDLRARADSDPTEEGDSREGRRKTYARSEALRAYVRRRADGRCEGCGQPAPFSTAAGEPYLEAHHTLRRSDSGPGNRRTVIALCPNCHTRVHYSADGQGYNQQLIKRLETLED